MSERANGWRLSRTVPTAIIIALVAWAFGAAWWTGRLSAAVDQHQRTIESRASHSLRIGILEERWRVISDTLREIGQGVKELRSRR